MQHIDFKPRRVCSQMIHIDLSDDGKTIEQVTFDGGCSGNLSAISKLVAGRPTAEIAEILKGNTCGPRGTSCADQFSQALLQAMEAIQAGNDPSAAVAN
ncbi:TIGR03905 family TSCPD domain-containing protein [Paratractidigestivibacter sp.]|uniref:TIGR03905 family TSCPD domain-containing protein n=1 Tax=Paratractidigestivibacter sp. TaxID=2847316 RepID=UPI002ABDD501|nr:TIGR03905 family TSCPD domain-containing protein [Paratractidigestivibacter sp.]